MVLENPITLSKPDVSGKLFCLKNLGKWAKRKRGFFLIFKKNSTINFPWICSIMKIYVICCVLVKSSVWENIYSSDIGQSVLSHSDCGIFKSSISSGQIDVTVSYFAFWYKFTKIKGWLKGFWSTIKNECA